MSTRSSNSHRRRSPLRYLTRVDGRSIPGMAPSDIESMTRSCEQIRRRTGWKAWYNRVHGTVMFAPGDRARGCVSEVVRSELGRGQYLPVDEDKVCKEIYSSRMSFDQVTQRMEANQRYHQQELQKEIRSIADTMSPELEGITRFARDKSISSHSQRIFIMNQSQNNRIKRRSLI